MAKDLTKKREDFARLYVEHGDASKAYREAFQSSRKWKNESVHRKAAELLKNVKVLARIEELMKKRAQKLDISQNRVLAEIAAIAFQDVGDLENENGTFRGVKNLPPATRKAVKTVKYKRYLERTGPGKEGFEEVEVIELQMHPKLPALEKICEIKGITKLPINQRPVEVNVNVKGKAHVSTSG